MTSVTLRNFIRCCAFPLALVLAGCGSGGGSSSDQLSTTASGSVSVLIADNPIDDFDQAVLDVEQVYLLPEDDDAAEEPVGLLSEPLSVDLLDLTNISELIVDGTSVAAGSYSKIRLQVSSITLNRTDDDGVVIPGESESVDVPASGKIDLNPRGTLVVAEGGELVLEIDVDLESSVKRNRGTGELRFRPVIFIDRIDSANRGRTSRLFGIMRDIDVGAGTLELCEAARLSNGSGNSNGNDRIAECVSISFDQETLIVGNMAEVLAAENLLAEDSATVYGHYREESLVANVIAVGERNSFQELEGDVSALPDATGSFAVTAEDLDGVAEGSVVTVSLVEGARIIGDDKQSLGDLASLSVGSEIEARGVLGEDGSGNPVFTAFILHLDEDDEDDDDSADSSDEQLELSGTLESVDLQAGTLTVIDEQGNSFCVSIDDDTDFFELLSTSESSESTEVSSASLEVGLSIEVSGEQEDGEDCVEAEDVVILLEGS